MILHNMDADSYYDNYEYYDDGTTYDSFEDEGNIASFNPIREGGGLTPPPLYINPYQNRYQINQYVYRVVTMNLHKMNFSLTQSKIKFST